MADGDAILSSQDGVREIKYGNSDYQVIETGRNTLRGFTGRSPAGRQTYLAARRSRGSKYGSLIIRIHGSMSSIQNDPRYNPAPGEEYRWMSRRILKSDAESKLWDFRYNEGGDGSSDSPYLREVSDLSGWNWDTIETVQFLSEPGE